MSLTIQFVGICTHIHKFGDANYRHRVVLVNAQNGAWLGKDVTIPPHTPRLIIDPKYIRGIDGVPYGLEPADRFGTWQLRGVQMKVVGATKPDYDRHPSYGKVPRMKSASTQLLPSQDVVRDGQAAAYFDIESGVVKSATMPLGAIATEVIVETNNKPALRVTAFWNKQSSLIRLTPDATITIEHTGDTLGDTENDFLLHYRIFGYQIPPDAQIPKEGKKKARARIPGNITVACSNSQYP